MTFKYNPAPIVFSFIPCALIHSTTVFSTAVLWHATSVQREHARCGAENYHALILLCIVKFIDLGLYGLKNFG